MCTSDHGVLTHLVPKVLETVASLNANISVDSLQAACHVTVGLADTACDARTPKPMPDAHAVAGGVAHGRPPDDSSPSP